MYGDVNKTTTGENYPMLAGNLVALFISMFLCIVLSYMYPQVRLVSMFLCGGY